MHGQSPDLHGAGVGQRRGRPRVRQPVDCRCGCGQPAGVNQWGRPRSYAPGHTGWNKRRGRAEWERRYAELVANAPLCECGCGERVRLRAGTLESFIGTYKGDRSYYRFAQGHDRRPAEWQHELTEPERQAVLGTLLGDSSIGYPHTRSTYPRIHFNHGGPQRAWAEHKAGFLSGLSPHVREHQCGGYGTTTVSVHTRCLPCLRPIHELVVRDGRKRISREWLDAIGPIGLAWWVGDDGSCPGNGFILHTEGYPEEDVRLAADWFGERYGPASVYFTKGKYFALAPRCEARRAMLRDIERHLPECMQYKLRSCRLRAKRRG